MDDSRRLLFALKFKIACGIWKAEEHPLLRKKVVKRCLEMEERLASSPRVWSRMFPPGMIWNWLKFSLKTVGLYNYLRQQTAPCEYRLIEEEVSLLFLTHQHSHLLMKRWAFLFLFFFTHHFFSSELSFFHPFLGVHLKKVGDLDSHLSLAETGLCWNSEELAGTLENIRRWKLLLMKMILVVGSTTI